MVRRSHLFSVCVLLGLFLNAQTEFEVSKIHDSISVKGSPNETFALYLPGSFSSDRLSPIVFIFDPGARGTVGIAPFIPASEKYGHILVCSNNSRNAPYDVNFTIANNLFNHIFSNFNIKEDEMYASGFSGGSRLASAIASLTDQFDGVIGCGAGFSGIQEHMPAAHKYAYVGMCGDRDMNYKEMIENKNYLNLIQFKSTLISYDGEHAWPPPEQMLRAFDWLYLERVKREKTVSGKSVLEYYGSDHEKLDEFRDSDKLLFEAEQLERMVKSYEGVLDIDSLKQQYASLTASKRLKNQLTHLESLLDTERKWVGKLDAQLLKDLKNPKKVKWSWWEKELEKLEKLRSKDDSETEKMIFRIRFDLFVRLYSRQNPQMRKQYPEKSKFIDEFLTLLRSSAS
ncbi:MAG: hypothetical protein AAF969_10315 [Bacteroidota bacterium]